MGGGGIFEGLIRNYKVAVTAVAELESTDWDLC